MERNSETVYYHESPGLIVNTLILRKPDYIAMRAVAGQAKGISVAPVPQDEAVDAYIKAANERKVEEAVIRYGTVEAAVARTLRNGGKVARIIVESKKGQARQRLESFEKRAEAEAEKRRKNKRT